MNIKSKLPNVGTTIFTVMSALAQKHGAVNLSQGFPNYPTSKYLQDLVWENMKKGNNQYAPMAGVPELRNSIAAKNKKNYHIDISSEEITITAGGTQALFTAIMAFVSLGDEVILIEPAYDSYRPAIELTGAKAVSYELEYPDYTIDWAAFARLLSPKTKMIIINTPHNPTGKIWSKDDMFNLNNLVKNTDIIVLSDEVYEHIIFDENQHHSVLLYPDLRQRSIAVYSFGKTLHNTGWKIGYVIAPDYLTKEFRKVHQFNVFSVNTPIQYAIASFLDTSDEYLEAADFLQKKRDFFSEGLQQSRFKLLPCAATYFQIADYSRISDEKDTDFAVRLTQEFGVSGVPVSAFYANQTDKKVLRFCFSKTEDTLQKAIDLLLKV